MSNYWEQMAEFNEVLLREQGKDMRALMLSTPFLDRELTDEDQAFLDERREVWAERDRRAKERDAEERRNAMTVADLAALLRDLPQDAPIQVHEHFSWGPEKTWADETHVNLSEDGSVFIGY